MLDREEIHDDTQYLLDAQIENIARNYKKVLLTRAEAAEYLADFKRDLEIYRAEILVDAYENKYIDGKNQGLREMQELRVLVRNDTYRGINVNIMKCEAKLALADADVKYHQTLISLTKAALYAQSALNL